MRHRECLCRSWEARSVEANEIRALSGNVSRAGAVMGAISGPIQEAASIHTQTVHIIHDNSGHQHSPPPARRGGSNLPSFHHARIACSCIPCALSIRLASGDVVSNNIRWSQAQTSVTGSEMTMASSPWNGCEDLLLPTQCYSCCCASAAVDASYRNASA